MRRAVIALGLILVVGGLALAQEGNDEGFPNESRIYFRTLYATRVFQHPLGYKVDYRTRDGRIAEVYLPIEWFSDAAGIGELIFDQSRAVPFMHVFYSAGEFSHVRLYLHTRVDHISNGRLSSSEDFTDEFSVETPTFVW